MSTADDSAPTSPTPQKIQQGMTPLLLLALKEQLGYLVGDR